MGSIEDTIPIIDFSKINGLFGSEKREEIVKVSEHLGSAMSGIGFAYLTNHGINMEKLEKIYKVAREFFELPHDVKMKYKKNNPGKRYTGGYTGAGTELLNEEVKTQTELKESLDIWGEYAKKEECFPAETPGMKTAFDELGVDCNNLLKKLLRCLGIFLKLDNEDFFLEHHNWIDNAEIRNQTHFRTLYYHPLESVEGIPTNAIRCGEHSDWGSITLLFQDMTGGLEVKRTNGEWVPATPIEGTVLINTGQLLELWTAGRLPATPHRVRILNDERLLKNPRQSCVYFVNPNGDAEVKTILPIMQEKPEFANSTGVNAYDHYLRLMDNATAY